MFLFFNLITKRFFVFLMMLMVTHFALESETQAADVENNPQLSQPILTQQEFFTDLKKSLTYLYKGSYLQFTQRESWYALGASSPLLIYAFDHDKRISQNISRKKKNDFIDATDHLAIVSTFPLIHGGLYFLGKHQRSEKLVQFSLEFISSSYLALLESGVISFIHVHRRPKEDRLSKWETNFRGDSSFPSGHVIPFAALTFKSWEFYGAPYALLPGIVTAVISYERIQNSKHYLSDVLGGILLAGLASFGVSAAVAEENALAEKNQQEGQAMKTDYKIHSSQQLLHWIKKHEVLIAPYPEPSTIGLKLSLTY